MAFVSNQHRSPSHRRVCVGGREGGRGFTYVSVSASACQKARFALRTKSCRCLPVFIRIITLPITQHTSTHSKIPAKSLSVPFCLFSRATDRLRNSTRALSPLLMPRHQQEIGFASFSVGFELVVPQLFSSPSLRPRSLLHNRSRTRYIRGARRTRPISTPCRHRCLAPTIVCQRVLLACPRRFQPCMW